jgi:prevent-host-death family protein
MADRTIAVKDLRKELSTVLGRVAYGHERVIVKRSGKDFAALIPVEDLELLEKLEDEMDLKEALRRLADGGDKAIPIEQARKELGL